ncbi:MAG: hypothetical protein HYR73_07755, partial [Candidatus Eisenbacteria bacterium]|nr:hypothetical protein [Candidatus Eisenbacteria bacterium]
DTLGLHVGRLFPLADSLQLTPDTLRAISVRYRSPLERLVHLADSLGMPVDSVGPFLLRERFNALSGSANASTFRYNSGYSLAQATSSWTNGADWNYSNRALLIHNSTQITMDRYIAGQYTSLRQVRSSVTEAGWRLTPQVSFGGRANLDRFDSSDPTSINNEAEIKNELQLSLRTRQHRGPGLTSELNLFGGVLDLSNTRQIKRGFSGELNGRLRATRGGWLTHEADGQLTGNLARTQVPHTVFESNTHDQSVNLHGTLGVLPSGPMSFNFNYTLRDSRIQAPADSGRIQVVTSQNNSLEGAMRLRQGNDRTVSFTGRLGGTRQLQNAGQVGVIQASESTRHDRSFLTDGRYVFGAWSLDGHFSLNGAISEYPHRDASGGYGESLFVRTVDATLNRPIGDHLIARANGTVTLSSYRYYRIGNYKTLPVNNDQYRQSYRVEGIYTPGQKFNTGVALEVIRSLAINIPAASTAGNNENHTYRAEWHWTYRLLPMLTATQRNQMTADYVFYDFSPDNNRLTLGYTIATSLNAVLTPRLSLDLNHNSRIQPSGAYSLQPDGGEAFGRADESRNYSLGARVVYTPTPGLALTVEPSYLSIRRESAVGTSFLPQRTSNTLNFAGGASLNVPLGMHAHLTGDIRRVFRDDRSATYSAGQPVPSPLSETDFWTGGLQLTWDM